MTHQRILANVSRDEFVGRDAELQQLVRQASGRWPRLVVMAAPGFGAGELMRHAYDQLFARRGEPVPIHFAFTRNERRRWIPPGDSFKIFCNNTSPIGE